MGKLQDTFANRRRRRAVTNSRALRFILPQELVAVAASRSGTEHDRDDSPATIAGIDSYLDVKQLRRQIESENRRSIEPEERLLSLASFEAAAQASQAMLRGQYLNRELPLQRWPRQAFADATALAQEMAYGYKIILQQQLAGRHLPLSSLHTALLRAQAHLNDLCLINLSCYHPTPHRFWRDWHTIYSMAELNGLADTAVAQSSSTLANHYLATSVFAQSDSHRLTSAQMHTLFDFLLRNSTELSLSSKPFAADTAATHAVVLDSDNAPIVSRFALLPENRPTRWFCLTALQNKLDQLLPNTTDEDNHPGNTAFSASLVNRLHQIWSASSRRQLPRNQRSSRISIVTGVQNLHHEMSLHSKTAAEIDCGAGKSEWTVLNRTRRGYGLSRKADGGCQIKVGSLAGIQTLDKYRLPCWQLAVVRWLQQYASGSLQCGIETLPGSVLPVSVTVIAARPARAEAGFLMNYVPGHRSATMLIVAADSYPPGQQLRLQLDESTLQLTLGKKIQLGASFDCFATSSPTAGLTNENTSALSSV